MTEHQSEIERKRQILASALNLFTTIGYGDTTMEQIAGDAGLSKGAIYWYFKGKLELLFALADQFVEESVQMLEHLAGQDHAGPEGLYTVHRELYSKRLGDPIQCRLLNELVSESTHHPEIKDRLVRYDRMWDEAADRLIAGGVEAGVFKPVDSHLLSQAIGGLYRGLTMRQQLDSELDVIACIETATRLFYEALIIHPPASS